MRLTHRRSATGWWRWHLGDGPGVRFMIERALFFEGERLIVSARSPRCVAAHYYCAGFVDRGGTVAGTVGCWCSGAAQSG
jgi:hypothetical protein